MLAKVQVSNSAPQLVVNAISILQNVPLSTSEELASRSKG